MYYVCWDVSTTILATPTPGMAAEKDKHGTVGLPLISWSRCSSWSCSFTFVIVLCFYDASFVKVRSYGQILFSMWKIINAFCWCSWMPWPLDSCAAWSSVRVDDYTVSAFWHSVIGSVTALVRFKRFSAVLNNVVSIGNQHISDITVHDVKLSCPATLLLKMLYYINICRWN